MTKHILALFTIVCYSIASAQTNVDNIAAFLEKADTETPLTITGNVTVTYHKGNQLFITDGTGSLNVYGQLGRQYANGTILSNISGTYGLYHTQPQMTPIAESFGEGTVGKPVNPVDVKIKDIQINQYVRLNGVDIVREDNKLYVKDNNTQMLLHDRFGISQELTPANEVSIVGIGGIYDNRLQLMPIEIDYTKTIEVGTIANFLNNGESDFYTRITGDVTVTYQKGRRLYVKDNTGSLVIYGEIGKTYINGTRLTGVTGKYNLYDGLPEMVARSYTFDNGNIGNPVTPAEVTIDKIQPNQYVKIVNATIIKADNKLYLTDGISTTLINDSFKLGAQLDDLIANNAISGIMLEGVTVVGIGSIYDGDKPQLFPIQITYNDASIKEITNSNSDKDEIIYNLNGQRLDAPVKGINIINGHKILVK